MAKNRARLVRWRFLWLGSFACLAACSNKEIDPKTDLERQGYVLGLNEARKIYSSKLPVDLDHFYQGVKDGQLDKVKRVSSEDSSRATYALAFVDPKTKERQRKGVKQRDAELLKQNRLRPGVRETASGLQYEILNPGTGSKPKKPQKVRFHLLGQLSDGSTFVDTHRENRPLELKMSGLIPSWREAVGLILPGGKIAVVSPPELAFGRQPGPFSVPPGSAVKFELELIEVQ